MIDVENDVPKYRKRKQSNVSKSRGKSDHKHKYAECLLVIRGSPYHSNYCTVCGKVKNTEFFQPGERSGGFTRMLNEDEMFEKFKNLKQFHVDNILVQYVDI